MYFTLTSNTVIRFDGAVDEPISNAVAILRRDIERILDVSHAPANVIRIERPCREISEEGWLIEVASSEITVQYNGSLGCVYALLFISGQFLGVSPFWFWNDLQFQKHSEIDIPLGTWRSPEYAVRYRGWFVNDEVLIDNWPSGQGDDHWRMVFEALLRCGGNITIPGTDGNSKKNRTLATSMGLHLTHHHAEPLGAEMFARVYPDKTPSYITNSHLFEKLWEQAVIEQKDYSIIWNLGFRGQGDRPFWDDDLQFATAQQRGKLISDIIVKQFEIIKRHIPNPVCCINIYGEVAELYRNNNLEIPQGIIRIWGDNGYGCMVSRRQGNYNPRVHALPIGISGGPHGIYYHCSFHDLQASNHLTMSPNAMEFMEEELEKVLTADARECWIVNSGSVKPHVHSLDLLREIWQRGQVNVNEWRIRYVTTYYSAKNTEKIAALFNEYASCTARYGSNDDDRAGEQLWHHPVRELLCCWIGGNTTDCLESILWLTEKKPFAEQVKTLKNICDETLYKWETFNEKCEELLLILNENERRLFSDSLLLHGRLHLYGAAGAKAFCESFIAFATGDIVSAFMFAAQSHSHYLQSVNILADAEHGKWTGYYNGDCLTDVRLTVICLNALVSYLRVIGDGPDFHKWERAFLTPTAERKVALLSSKQRAMTDEELAGNMTVVTIPK